MKFKFVTKWQPNLWLIFRAVVGFMFFSHGAQKLLGWFGGQAVPLMSKFGLAGSIEILVGLGILLGLYVRLAALSGVIYMGYIYLTVHISQGFSPLVNEGEIAVLFFVSFLVLLGWGTGKWSLDNVFFKKEVF